ncbi:MAG: CaiB/BaiF CoA-transferase family protein [Myxococcota bacterium]|nr:CaiB/BaiF CoA-transferase family protein [Myxococcota bacterium]
MGGPLAGMKIIELAGLGALPYGSLRLADMGAEIVRVERLSDVPEEPVAGPHNFWDRGRRSIGVDLKHPEGVETVLCLAEQAEVFLESFRPGVAERLGLGPEALLARNPRIVYGRLTGWGQDGPLAQAAGHSLNYEAITGVTHTIGPRGGPPLPLLQILGDFAGGGLHLAFGVVCAVLEARQSGQGQVVDGAMVDGVMSLMSVFYGMHSAGIHTDDRGSNLFDGGAPFYNIYETKDGEFVSIAPIEPHFYALLIEKLGLDSSALPEQNDRERWPELRAHFEEAFATKTRAEWDELLLGTDACYAPVLSLAEVVEYEHHRQREAFVDHDPMPELRPSPRLSRTPGTPGPSPEYKGANTVAVLESAGYSAKEIEALRRAGAVR